MGIFKKPRVLIITAAAVVLVLAGIAAFFLLRPQKTVGLFGIERESEEVQLLCSRLEKEGYRLFFAEDIAELTNADCAAWIVAAQSDGIARQVQTAVGDKVIYIQNKPDPEGSVRYAGFDMDGAGQTLIQLISYMPSGGDTNEDGLVSCLVLTGSSQWEMSQWQAGLQSGISQAALPIEILQTLSCDGEEAAREAVSGALAQYGRDIEAILCPSEALAEGAAKAISGRGWVQGEDFYLLSTGTLDHMENRSGMAYYRQEDYVQLICEAVEDTLSGKAPRDYLLALKLLNNAPLK